MSFPSFIDQCRKALQIYKRHMVLKRKTEFDLSFLVDFWVQSVFESILFITKTVRIEKSMKVIRQ